MIRFGAILSVVIVAIGLLAAGAVSADLTLVYLSIGVAALALVMLVAGIAIWRDDIFGKPKSAQSAQAVAMPADAHVGQAAPEPAAARTLAAQQQAAPQPMAAPPAAAQSVAPQPVAAQPVAAQRGGGREPGPDQRRGRGAGHDQRPAWDLPVPADRGARPTEPPRPDRERLDRERLDRQVPAKRPGEPHEVAADLQSGQPGATRERAGADTGAPDRATLAAGWAGPDARTEWATTGRTETAQPSWPTTASPPEAKSAARPQPSPAKDRQSSQRTVVTPASPGPAAPGTPSTDVPATAVPTTGVPATAVPATAVPTTAKPAQAPAAKAVPASAKTVITGPPGPADDLTSKSGAEAEAAKPAAGVPAKDGAATRVLDASAANGVTAPAGPSQQKMPEDSSAPAKVQTAVASSAGPDQAEASGAAATQEVTIVPGIARYHLADCILIRFLGAEDLESMTRRAAEEAGCVPCRACRPEKALASS